MPIVEPVDGATAATHVAYALTEQACIFPITPSTPLADNYDQWTAKKMKNAFGLIPSVKQLDSELGAAGSLHGTLCAGTLGTTFTASQGLLLMIPNMYKIAGELLPCVIHCASRSVAQHSLSIFGDHSDLYAARVTGFAILSGSSVQEAHDMAIVSHLSSLKSRVPFIHNIDGFRVTHEINKVQLNTFEEIKSLVDENDVTAFRKLALDNTNPTQRGTSQTPDVYFTHAEACSKYYAAVPDIVQDTMDKVATLTGRKYELFSYHGDKNATDVMVIMGSSAHVVKEYINYLGDKSGLGMINVHLFRPWSNKHILEALPKTVKRVCVLDKAKESNNAGPLFLDVSAALKAGKLDGVTVIGGRYGISSKDFTPNMVHACLDNMRSKSPKDGFTVGINDDVMFSSLDIPKEAIDTIPKGTVQACFWGLGSDGTVGANKNAIKIICSNTKNYGQGYFVYDANKFGGLTVSHLRFGPTPITAHYSIQNCDYIAVSQQNYVHRFDLLRNIKEGGVFVLNTRHTNLKLLDDFLPASMKNLIAKRKVRFYVIDAVDIAFNLGLGRRTNMVLQAVFFRLGKVLPLDQAVTLLKGAIEKTYGKKGEKVVKMNCDAVDAAMKENSLIEIKYPAEWATTTSGGRGRFTGMEETKTTFVNGIYDKMASQTGDDIPVSSFLPGGVIEASTASFAKRGVAIQVPHWNSETCIQCNKCTLACPHAVIRPFLMKEEEYQEGVKKGLKDWQAIPSKDLKDGKFKIQISPLDCTGCTVCTSVCPVEGTLTMKDFEEEVDNQVPNWNYVSTLPHHHGSEIPITNARSAGFHMPLMEFPGACAGCGETPYVRLLTQLFGENMIVANATGCSSIWGASYPHNPYTKHPETGRGPAWANSLFEDNAQFGYGIVTGHNRRKEGFLQLINSLIEDPKVPSELVPLFKQWLKVRDDNLESTKVYEEVKKYMYAGNHLDQVVRPHPLLNRLEQDLNMLVRKSMWLIGGDGWAYDIGFGGLDHVLQSGENFNVLVLDTEVYSNTGGQRSKATNMGALAKFAAAGKDTKKKDLGSIAMSYEDVYVGSIAMGMNMEHAVKTLREAEAYEGPSIVIAYCPCTEHGYEEGLAECMKTQASAVESGYWTMYRYNPALIEEGKNPFSLDCRPPNKNPFDFLKTQARFRALYREHADEAKVLHEHLQDMLKRRRRKFNRIQLDWEREKEIEEKETGVKSDASKKEKKEVPKGDMNTVLVMYATESGNSEEVAGKVVEECTRLGLKVAHGEAKCMDSLSAEYLEAQQMLICINSSTGVGEMPENGKDILEMVQKKGADLSGVKAIAFGLGDSSFNDSYLKAPKDMVAGLQECGAELVYPMGEGDDRDKDGFHTGLDAWLMPALKALTGVSPSSGPKPAASAPAKKTSSSSSPAKPAPTKPAPKVPEAKTPTGAATATAKKSALPPVEKKLLVAFATETGKSEEAAEYIVQEAKKRGFETTLECMEDIDVSTAASFPCTILVTSTVGQGDCPENGEEFLQNLEEASSGLLRKTRVAVFGLGDTTFKKTYLKAAYGLYDAAKKAGGVMIGPTCGEGNDRDSNGFMEGLKKWVPDTLTEMAGVAQAAPAPASAATAAAGAQEGPVGNVLGNFTEQAVSRYDAGQIEKEVSAPRIKPNIFNFVDAPKINREVCRPGQISPDHVFAPDVYFVGAIDWDVRNFHGYETRKGSSYNAYLINDDHPTLIDTVKYPFAQTLLENIANIVPLDKLEYLVLNHAEPDHSSSTPHVVKACPNVTIVTTSKCKTAMEQNFDTTGWRWKIVSAKEKFNIGKRNLQFIPVPMVHWPESMWTYDSYDKILYSNDAFGQHIASTRRFDDQYGLQHLMEFNREYYANILMPCAGPIRKALKAVTKLNLDISIIATAHGLSWRKWIKEAVDSYVRWTSNKQEAKVMVVYDSMWAATKMMAERLEEGVRSTGASCELLNASILHITEIAAQLLEASAVCVGSPALNNNILPTIHSAVGYMTGLAPEKKIGFSFGSYGWQGGMLSSRLDQVMKDIGVTLTRDCFTVQFKPSETDLQQIWEDGRKLGLQVLDTVSAQQKE